MERSEILNIVIAMAVLILVIGFEDIISFNPSGFGLSIIFGILIISLNILAKKITANKLDAELVNNIWFWRKYGFKARQKLKKSIPAGVIFPIFLTAFSLGSLKLMTILSYETTALKRRAAKRFGISSFTEMTDKHIGAIGAAGIVAVLALSFIAYWIPGTESLSKYAAFYAFWNMIPFSQLDGAKIFFGDRVQWSVLAIITLIFVSYALLLS